MATTRLYRIDPQESALALDVPAAHAASTRLVEAATSSQALRHVAKGQYLVTVPNTKEVAALMAKGATVEVAGAE